MKDYSQGGEQQFILDLLADHPPGRLLDIGAANGIDFSNTRALLESGWGGVLAEPEPSNFLLLHELYREREDIILINAAVGIGWHLTRFWRTADLVSTTSPEHYLKWQNAAVYTGMYYTATVPISTLFIEPGFDLVSIDTEGSSAALGLALLRLPERLQPRVLVVEHDGQRRELAEAAAHHGFSVRLTNAENVILAR